MNIIRHSLAFILVCSLFAFGQDEPEKIAVYAYGAGEAGINKSLGNKLLSAIVQSGKYAEIGDLESFYKELAKNNEDGIGPIVQAAKQYGADIVCVVSLTEVFGAYSIFARAIKTSDSQIIRTISLDRSLNSLDDLTRVSNELSVRLFQLPPSAPPLLPSAAAIAPVAPAAAVVAAPVAKKECTNKLNINELVSKIQSGFPAQLKDCSVTLAKNIALSKSPFGKKTPPPEPKSFMMECTIDGIKQRLPSGAGEYVKPIENFIQSIMSVASAADGGLDVKKLSGAISGMNVNDLINDIKMKAVNDPCMENKPYVPPFEYENAGSDEGENSSDDGGGGFGIRAGFNFSYLYGHYNGGSGSSEGSYNSIPGFQLGFVWDIPTVDWFHLLPGLMYIQKGAEDKTSHYIEIPLLLSLKFSAFRLHVGPYIGICVAAPEDYINSGTDIGFNSGFGFDIGMFYIGLSYEYGFSDVSDKRYFDLYNRTIGFNFGVNL